MSQSPKSVDELRDIARSATRTALSGHKMPADIRDNVVLGEFMEGDFRIFQLYVPGLRPEDGQVVSRVAINTVTGEPGAVSVYLPWKDESEPHD